MPASSETVAIVLPSDVDLHARPAATLVRVALGFASRIVLATDEREADAKSLLALLALGAKGGTALTLTAEGPDAPAALNAVGKCIGTLSD